LIEPFLNFIKYKRKVKKRIQKTLDNKLIDNMNALMKSKQNEIKDIHNKNF